MEFTNAITKAFAHYTDFEGRASRSEFWYFILFQFLVGLALSQLPYGLLWFWEVAVFLPSLAVGCRRLHDIGRSGLYLFLLLIPVAGQLVLVIWWTEPSQPEANPYGNRAARQSRSAPVRRPALLRRRQHLVTCLSGPMQGQVFHLGTQGLTFGRTPACAVRFPGNMPGVSSEHCRLMVRNGQLLLEDLNSTYGTFLSDGTSLPPRYPHPIAPHTRFYLGTGACSFEITA